MLAESVLLWLPSEHRENTFRYSAPASFKNLAFSKSMIIFLPHSTLHSEYHGAESKFWKFLPCSLGVCNVYVSIIKVDIHNKFSDHFAASPRLKKII
jgi:hypothetical protein